LVESLNTQASRFNAARSDRYRIERELGAGGMATVYLAEAAGLCVIALAASLSDLRA
jgi:hypothetical protein